ncbi:uncharacterized protein LOC142349046 [Convolutriloba macropyga]|uniref:uncharacterized protein LOC142349046 n=1 Tax=Convolutriloba macropyga TaxID=536237 RepID=UPI003F520827
MGSTQSGVWPGSDLIDDDSDDLDLYDQWRADPEGRPDWMVVKLASEAFMVPLCVTTIILNSYFLFTIYKVNELRSLDYFLIAIQSSLDLTLTGVLGLLHYLLHTWASLALLCGSGGFLNKGDYLNIKAVQRFPKWCEFCQKSAITRYVIAAEQTDDYINIENAIAWDALFKYTIHFETLRLFIDISTYWSQLVLSLAIAIERYILIVRSHDSNVILSKPRRRVFYALVVIAICIVPPIFITDFTVNMDAKTRNACDSCLRFQMRNVEPYVRLALNIIMATACSLLYYKCVKTLQLSATITRSGVLTAAFAAILVCWVLMVTPHVIFTDFKLRGKRAFFDNFLHEYNTRQLNQFIWATYQGINFAALGMEDFGSDTVVLQKRLMLIETGLRGWRFSYGFVNTILVLILIKPFHEPIKNFCRSCLRKREGDDKKDLAEKRNESKIYQNVEQEECIGFHFTKGGGTAPIELVSFYRLQSISHSTSRQP